MLKEKLYFEEDMPVRISIADIESYPLHFHEDMEIVFVLSGRLSIKNGYMSNTMQTGDVYIHNPKDIHSYDRVEGEPNIVMMLQIDSAYFSRFHPDWEKGFFVCDLENDDAPETEMLRETLSRIIMEHTRAESGYETRIVDLVHGLVTLLMDEFRFFALDKSGRFSNDSGGKKNKLLAGRMNRIQDYLYDNYFKKVTLQDIAEREHLSIYYLSHVIKDATGLSYKEFLNYIRVEESEKLLLGTDMKVSAISEAVGFSATRYFVKYFKLWFGMEPRDYRAQHPGQVSDRGVAAQVTPIEPKAIREAVRKLSNEIYRKYAALPPSETKVIAVDARVNVPFQPVNHPPNTPTLSRRLNNTDRARHSKLLWDMFRKIEGQIAAEGEDYILKIENDGGNARAAILVSNPADRFAVKEEQPAQRVVIAASRSGSYEVVRIKHTRRNMDAAEARRSALTTGREDVINTIMAFPEVKREEMIAIASLVFEVVLEPDESELILLDEG